MTKKQPAGIGMTPSKTELGSFIRARRIELGLRQVHIAEEVGIPQNIISGVEIGKRKYFNEDVLVKLSFVLKCDAEELRKRMPVKPKAEVQTELGKLIHSRREELGMTLDQFAKKMKMTPQRAKRLEVRKSPYFRYNLLNPLAKVLNLDPAVLSKFVGTTQKETKSELGQLVRSRRKELGLSVRGLAQKMDTSGQYVNQIEFGQARLSDDDTIVRLAQALELDAGKLEAVRPERRLKTKNTSSVLGGFLASKRLELHLTQREVAERAEIRTQYVSAYETGRLQPSVKVLDMLAKALNCEIPPEMIPPPHIRKYEHGAGYNTKREPGLGKFLTEKRLGLKLSQAQFAQKAEISAAVVSGIERGTYRLGSKILGKISKAIGCKIPQEFVPVHELRPGSTEVGFVVEQETGLGKFLTARRLELKLSQAQVAQRTNTGTAVISGIERGTYRLGSSMSERLSKALECEIPAELIPQPRQRISAESTQQGFASSPVVVHLSEQNLADLDRIKKLSDIRVNTEAVKKALKILRILLEKQKDGHTVCLRKEGNIVELEFLF